ncbi:MAG: universal stress protein [Bacteroidota bacterium]
MKSLNIQNILIPIDFSETSLLALEHAVFMAKIYKAEITLLHVIETMIYTSAITFPDAGHDLASVIETKAKEKLNEFATNLQEKEGIKINCLVETGRIYKSIVEIAETIKADMIIMGTHGVSGFREFVVGSNAFRVITESPCPTISVQTHITQVGFHSVVLPIDDSLASRQKVSYAADIALKYNAKIHIAGLITEEDDQFAKPFKMKITQIEEYLAQHNVKFDTKYLHGTDLAGMSLDYASELKADLIVIMTDQEPDYEFSRIMMGPYSQHIVNHSKIPVMSINSTLNIIEVNAVQTGF